MGRNWIGEGPGEHLGRLGIPRKPESMQYIKARLIPDMLLSRRRFFLGPCSAWPRTAILARSAP